MIPPNFIHTSPYEPLRVLTYPVRANGRHPETLLAKKLSAAIPAIPFNLFLFRICMLRNALLLFYPRPFSSTGLSAAYSNSLLFSLIAMDIKLHETA